MTFLCHGLFFMKKFFPKKLLKNLKSWLKVMFSSSIMYRLPENITKKINKRYEISNIEFKSKQTFHLIYSIERQLAPLYEKNEMVTPIYEKYIKDCPFFETNEIVGPLYDKNDIVGALVINIKFRKQEKNYLTILRNLDYFVNLLEKLSYNFDGMIKVRCGFFNFVKCFPNLRNLFYERYFLRQIIPGIEKGKIKDDLISDKDYSLYCIAKKLCDLGLTNVDSMLDFKFDDVFIFRKNSVSNEYYETDGIIFYSRFVFKTIESIDRNVRFLYTKVFDDNDWETINNSPVRDNPEKFKVILDIVDNLINRIMDNDDPEYFIYKQNRRGDFLEKFGVIGDFLNERFNSRPQIFFEMRIIDMGMKLQFLLHRKYFERKRIEMEMKFNFFFPNKKVI